ncbi:MAG: CpaF family protein [Lachnospiraceae bacterium]|nr:CpaF family protein [Lachnospiraceae bacterium]
MEQSKETISSIKEKIIRNLDLSKHMSDEEIRDLIDGEILRHRKSLLLSPKERIQLSRDIFYNIRRYGILQELLQDSQITEIMVNGTEPVFVEKKGKLIQLSIRFESQEMLKQVIQQMVSEANRVVNEAAPIVDVRLKDGSRVNVVLSPVAINGPILTIRRFPEEAITMQQLIAMNSVSKEIALFLQKQVEAGKNILVCGGTGCGKTTFLNVLSGFIPEEERVITIEDSAELQLHNKPNLVRLETRNANVEGCREITIRDLLKTSLRMRPDRIIVGEVRGKEAVDMLQSVNVGHSAMTTVHANSVRDVISRLETMVLMGMELPISAIRRQIASGFDLMIHLGRLKDGSRRLLEIASPQLTDKNGEIFIKSLYRLQIAEESMEGRIMGRWVKENENSDDEIPNHKKCNGNSIN